MTAIHRILITLEFSIHPWKYDSDKMIHYKDKNNRI